MRDLDGGRVRRFRVRGPRHLISSVQVDAAGRMLVSEVRPIGRSFRQLVRLRSRDGAEAIVFRSPDGFSSLAEARFCGRHAVLHVVNRRRARLTTIDPRRVLHEGPAPTGDFRLSCDARQFVVLDDERRLALVHDLPE